MEPKNDNEDVGQEDDTETKKFVGINEHEPEAEFKISSDDIEKHLTYLKSDKTWDVLEIPEEIRNNLIAKNFKKPSKIQSLSIGFFKKEIQRDLMAQAQNGSGKTLAFVVPSLMISLAEKEKNPADPAFIFNPSVLILSDTKELCYQTLKVINLIKPSSVHANVCLKELNEYDSKVDILLTTVGSFLVYNRQKKINTKRLRLIVFDECDRLFGQDQTKNSLPIMVKKMSETNENFRICYFSATYSDSCIEVIKSMNRKVTTISIENKKELSLENLTHYFIKSTRKEKFDFVNVFFKKFAIYYFDGSVIMFVNSKSFAEKLAKKLYEEGHKCEILTSDMSHEDRLNIMEEFRSGKIKILISTNLLSRGIDNRKVNLVINYDLPFIMTAPGTKGPRHIDTETYLHRVGRTARFGDQGLALNIIEKDSELNELMKITAEFGIKFTEITMDNFTEVIEKNKQVSEYNVKKREYLEENI